MLSVVGASQVEPVGGGRLVALGRVWVSPEAEFDPRAVRMSAEGRGLPAEAILKRYLPEAQPLTFSCIGCPHLEPCKILNPVNGRKYPDPRMCCMAVHPLLTG